MGLAMALAMCDRVGVFGFGNVSDDASRLRPGDVAGAAQVEHTIVYRYVG